MEEEKKKKKNKKKRGKQTKTSEDAAIADGEAASLEHNHMADPKQNHHIHVQNAGMLELDVKMNGHQIDEVKGVSSTDLLEEEVRQLQAEKQSWLQREKLLEEEIKQVMLDKHSWILKEANLKEKIELLQDENDSWRQKEARLEEIIKRLQSEKDSWTLKEANFEEKLKHLGSGKEYMILKENSTKEMIGRLNDVNIGLQLQVKELEESRNALLEENQWLAESLSHSELRIQHLERDSALFASSVVETTKHGTNEEDPISLVEAAQALIEKLIVENAELVEKVNELCIELDRCGITAAAQSSMVGFDPPMVIARAAMVPDHLSEHGETMPLPNEVIEFPTSIQRKDETMVVVANNADAQSNVEGSIQKDDELLGSFKTSESTSEIVEVPLDENDIQEVKIMQVSLEENTIELKTVEAGQDAGLPLSDAPLIGAPFRLISFVAKYVSGADLVNKNSLDPQR